MAQIVNLNELVPEDIVIRYGTPPKDYRLPGDISVDSVFRLFAMFQALTATPVEGEGAALLADLKNRFGDIEAELLALFQIRDPKMTTLPFGIASLNQVLRIILASWG